MTNLEKVLENDRERFIKEIAEKICFNTSRHKVNVINPPLCGDCNFGEHVCNRWKCHTEEIIEWLNSEAESEGENETDN